MDSILKIRVVENHNWTFATELKGHPFQVALYSEGLHTFSCWYASREANLCDFHMTGEYCASTAVSHQDLEDTRRKARLHYQLSERSSRQWSFLAWIQNENVPS